MADLLLLEAWERLRPMRLGVMLRVRQIRKASPDLTADIEAELGATSRMLASRRSSVSRENDD
ncbi:hypothetical protein [Acidisphaera sp. L21]|uniref:hypothetical protein n=1 Tax=Acidisphaera sp. L21 TaxID=1641851 RepID=UPI00131B541B|nr:hypothetical protein [Acidisphaera sp. L21]